MIAADHHAAGRLPGARPTRRSSSCSCAARSELARENLAAEPDEARVPGARPAQPERLRGARARGARRPARPAAASALDHVAVVISDKGRRHRAYGLYQGDTVARDNYPDRIVIFRDTLLRDFGHDPDELRAQVTRTVRHELAHHLGADELGVRELGPVMIVMTPEATEAEIAAVEARLETTGVHVLVHAGRADDRDRRDRRPRGRARARPRGHGGRRPRRPDLAALQARLLRARPPRADACSPSTAARSAATRRSA